MCRYRVCSFESWVYDICAKCKGNRGRVSMKLQVAVTCFTCFAVFFVVRCIPLGSPTWYLCVLCVFMASIGFFCCCLHWFFVSYFICFLHPLLFNCFSLFHIVRVYCYSVFDCIYRFSPTMPVIVFVSHANILEIWIELPIVVVTVCMTIMRNCAMRLYAICSASWPGLKEFGVNYSGTGHRCYCCCEYLSA